MSRIEGRRTTIATLTLASLIAGFAASAVAQQHSNPPVCTAPTATTFDLGTLPSIDSIGSQTNMAVFMQRCVPEEVRIAALRRAWSVDPAIRDYKGLQENDWDFDVNESILGFADLDSDADVQSMLARLFGEPTRVAARTPERADHIYDMVFLFIANWLQRPFLGAVHD